MIVDDHVLSVSTSIGIALWPNDSDSVDQLLRFSDMAMYSVKQAGKNGVGFFHPQIDEEARSRAEVESDLREALRLGQFLLHYQPQFCLQTGRLKGVEALIRWKQPDRGMVLPGDFIDIAEETDLIHQIGDWVLVEASRQARKWLNVGYSIKVAVNISARQFVDTLPDRVEQIQQNFKLPATMLELELTETALMANAEQNAVTLQRFRHLGVGLAIDDFGTGYSSLAYLKRLPVDELKIDKSFVMGMESGEDDAMIVRSTIDLAHNLGLTVVAEGVETAAILERLRALACDEAQGYHIARPLPVDDFLAWQARQG